MITAREYLDKPSDSEKACELHNIICEYLDSLTLDTADPKAKRMLLKLHELDCGPHFDVDIAIKAVASMENVDGTTGPHWTFAFEQQNCCCEQKQLILQNMANNDKNTCELKTAIHAEGEATRAMIANNQIQDLREKIADKDRELQTANFNLSQVAQSAAIVGKISPRPVPAYMTASPYQSLYGCGGVMV